MSSRKAKASRRISRGQDRAARMSRMKPGVLTTEDARRYIQQVDEYGFMRSEDATKWRSRGEAQNPRIPPLPLPLPVLLFVIPQRSGGIRSSASALALFPCHSDPERSRRGRIPAFRLCPCRCLSSCLSFRSAAEESALPPALALSPCHSDPERSRGGRIPAFRLCPCPCLSSSCLSFRSAAEESALPPAQLPPLRQSKRLKPDDARSSRPESRSRSTQQSRCARAGRTVRSPASHRC